MIKVEHRPIPGRVRSAGTWNGRFKQAKRSMATHVTVLCDAYIRPMAGCPARYLASQARNAEEGRAEAAEADWSCDGEANHDLCPTHATPSEDNR
jgi:hypothetical protein